MTIFLLMIAAYGAGALLALFLRGSLSRWSTALGAVSGSILGIAVALGVLFSHAPIGVSLSAAESVLAIKFSVDPLGAFFLLLIGIIGIPSAIYTIGYSHHSSDSSHQRFLGCMLNVFFLSMSLVVAASSVVTFLIFWEAMSLASYFLVVANQTSESLSAGLWYAGMAHAGFGLILAAFLLMSIHTADMSFDQIRALSLSPALKDLVFVLALLGFGSKAGLVPLHVWLPRAHPAAPSHISAMMSGVMVKLGIYGIIRLSLDLLGGGPAWWGGLLLALGAVSALLGVLYALMEHDLKRLLAYSTVENIGLISMGIGLALIFRGYGMGSVAALALVAGLYHTLNHGAFKGLLFLGAGSVLHAAGTKKMEELGGLIHRLPVTAVCFLIGAAAISGLPPLNGFASEWMLFQSLMAGVGIPQALVGAMMAVAVGMLALTAGLAAACFVKAFGISFLAIPRSKEAEAAREVSGTMLFGMLFLAVLCVVLGILPFWVAPFLAQALAGLPGINASTVTFHAGVLMEVPAQSSHISSTLVALLMAGAFAIVPLLFKMLGVNWKVRRADSWGCGRVGQTARMEYTSTAFAEPLRRVFSALYQPTKNLTIDFHPESKYFVQSIQYRSEVRTWFEEYLYNPLGQWISNLGNSARTIQSGSVHWYLGYIFVALLAFLLMARWL